MNGDSTKMLTVGDVIDELSKFPREKKIAMALDRFGKKTTGIASISLCDHAPMDVGRGTTLRMRPGVERGPMVSQVVIVWPERGVKLGAVS